MENLAYFLQGMELRDDGGEGGGVDRDLGYVDGPGVRGVGVAHVLLVVPEDVLGGFVSVEDFEVAELLDVAADGVGELGGGVRVAEGTGEAQSFEQVYRRMFEQLADDHRGA